MLRATIAFFVFGIIAYAVGAYNIAGVSIELGKILLAVFVVLALLTLIAGTAIGGRASKRLN